MFVNLIVSAEFFSKELQKELMQDRVRFSGTLGNPHYLARYNGLCAILCLLIFYNSKSKYRYFWFLPLIYNLLTIKFTNTKITFAVLGASFIAFTACLLIKKLIKKSKKFLALSIAFLLPLLFFIVTFTFNFNVTNPSLNNRLNLIKVAKTAVSKNIITGVGEFNFLYALTQNYDSKKHKFLANEFWFDTTHNVYADILVEKGIFALILFLLVYYNVCKQSIIKRNKFILWVSLYFFFYGFFLFNDVLFWMYFYVFLAFLVVLQKNAKTYTLKVTNFTKPLMVGVLLITFISFYFLMYIPKQHIKDAISLNNRIRNERYSSGQDDKFDSIKNSIYLNNFALTLLRATEWNVYDYKEQGKNIEALDLLNKSIELGELNLLKHPNDKRTYNYMFKLFEEKHKLTKDNADLKEMNKYKGLRYL